MAKPRGVCPDCSRHIRLTPTGRLYRHGARHAWAPSGCTGWGSLPREVR